MDRFIAPPATCDYLENIAVNCGGSVDRRADGADIDYALPVNGSMEVRKFFRSQAAVCFGPTFVVELPGGRVFGSGNVFSPDGRSIARDVSPDFGKLFQDHWLLTYKKIPTPLPVAGTTAVIATTLGTGYGHWLLEELPRLLALPPRGCDSLIAHAAGAHARVAIALHGFSGNVLEATRASHFVCEQLVVPSLGCPTPTTLRTIEEFTAPVLHSAAFSGERIYISREKARRRQVANEPELWAALASRGFVKLHLEDLTWPQQMAAFHGAKVIVSPHGAGLANLVFCQAGTRVIECFHRSYVNGCFWRIAALCGLDYRPLVSAGPEPLTQALHANRLDIAADVAQVIRTL